MNGWMIEFDEMGGYDCITGAWIIFYNQQPIVTIDQSNFGQTSCDFDFRSKKAEIIAYYIFNALKQMNQNIMNGEKQS